MYNRIFIFALCVLCCFVGCKTSETRGTELSAANRDENIFIDGDDTDIMQSDQAEGSAVEREFSDDDDAVSSGMGSDDEDDSDGSGVDVETSGAGPRTGSAHGKPVISTPPTTSHPKSSRPFPPDETSTTPKSEPTKSPTIASVVPAISTKTTTTERPLVPTQQNNDANSVTNPPKEKIDKIQEERPTSFFSQPGILAAVIGGAVVGLLCAILLVMFIVYRMRKKDEGSYALDEPKRSPRNTSSYQPPNKEFYA